MRAGEKDEEASILLVILAAITIISCGGADTPEPTATPEPPPATPTPMPPTPTEDTICQEVQVYLGDWSGEWRNIIYGSSGPVNATLAAEEDGKVSFTVDLDGFVFGALDPDPVTYVGSFSSDGAVADDFILPLLQSVFS